MHTKSVNIKNLNRGIFKFAHINFRTMRKVTNILRSRFTVQLQQLKALVLESLVSTSFLLRPEQIVSC